MSLLSDEITSDVHTIKIEHGRISGEYWRGHYGTAMKEISLEWSK